MSGDNLGQLEYECRVGKVDGASASGVRAKRSRRRGDVARVSLSAASSICNM